MKIPIWLFGFWAILAQANTIYIVPYPGTRPEITFYNPQFSPFAKKWVALREALEEEGYTIKFTQNAENLTNVTAIISLTNINANLLANLPSYPKERCWLFLYEPPVFSTRIYSSFLTEYFQKIFVLFDDLADEQTYFKFYYAQPLLKSLEASCDFSEKKFCVVMAGNKRSFHPQELYSARLKTIAFFNNFHPGELDLYGIGWHDFPNWKGTVLDKWKTLQNYKFCICYENMKDQYGYITEKIFDCFVSSCVPIYWGASNITQYIPAECFIDRRQFADEEMLYQFLKTMTPEQHQNYIDAASRFFSSPQAELFSIPHFIQFVRDQLKGLPKQPKLEL